jgi:lipopolysaccharide/colanic/teichoic acid biosynthesis glycosyltransferase
MDITKFLDRGLHGRLLPQESGSDHTGTGGVEGSVPTDVPRWKRILDIACIVVFLPVLIPLSLCIALLIKLGSSGPVLFRQERVGHMGRRFTCYKFRTMGANSDLIVHYSHVDKLIESNLPMEKLDTHNDSRVIPFGRLLRASGADELPQLINVWKGEMSLVGPRPCLPFEYKKHRAWQKQRFHTLPGLTGLWQVSGKNKTTFVEMIRLDIAYAQRKSLWLDLTIMGRTIPTLIGQIRERRQAKTVVHGRNPTNRAAKRESSEAAKPLYPLHKVMGNVRSGGETWPSK